MKTSEISSSSIQSVSPSTPPPPTPTGLASVPDQLVKSPQKQGWLQWLVEKFGGAAAYTITAGGNVTYGNRLDITPPKVEEIDLDLEAIKRRRAAPSPTQAEIDGQVKQLSDHLARLLPMRIIDQVICGSDKSEDFYLSFVAKVGPDELTLKKEFFKYLDKSDLFFPVRWAAKIAYKIFVPICKQTIQNTTLSIFKSAEEFLDKNNKTEFNELFNVILERSNFLLEEWVVALGNIQKGPEVKDTKGLLREELAKPKYYNNMSASDFYYAVTKKLVQKFYVDFSFGPKIYKRLMAIDFTRSPAGTLRYYLTFALTKLIRVPLFCIALPCRILLIVPDYLFNWISALLIRRAMVRNRVIENLVERVLQGISTNKGLSVPVLRSLNDSLEELLAETMGKLPEIKSEDGLSQKNQKALKRNVHMILRAVDLYSSETIKDLKQMLASKEKPFTGPKAEIEKAFEELFKGLYQRLTDAKLLRDKGYHVIQAVTESLKAPPIPAKERNREFKEQEDRLYLRIRQVLVAAVTKKVKELGFSEGAIVANVNVNPILKETEQLIKNLIDTLTSREFLNFQIRAGLAVALLKEDK